MGSPFNLGQCNQDNYPKTVPTGQPDPQEDSVLANFTSAWHKFESSSRRTLTDLDHSVEFRKVSSKHAMVAATEEKAKAFDRTIGLLKQFQKHNPLVWLIMQR